MCNRGKFTVSVDKLTYNRVMPTVHLENGGTIGVYGDVLFRHEGADWVVDLQGIIATVTPPGLMSTLKQTTAVSMNTDALPGHVLYQTETPAGFTSTEYFQVPTGLHTKWILDEEDASLT